MIRKNQIFHTWLELSDSMVMVTAEAAAIWGMLRPFEREILERYGAVGKMPHP